MPKLTFCVPVHDARVSLAAICLRQLSRTCESLRREEINATAIVVSDFATLEILKPEQHGFGHVCRDNVSTSRRFNDAIQLATDPDYSDEPADFVVPFGSDDWADHRCFLEPLPPADTIQGFQRMSVVSEDGRQITLTHWRSEGGCGIRIIPRELVAPLGYRPGDEDRKDGCDTSILINLRRHHGDRLKVRHCHVHDQQIVDWKTLGIQLHSYRDVTTMHQLRLLGDPFEVLAGIYPDEALLEMRDHYFGFDVSGFADDGLVTIGGVAHDA